MLSRTGKVLLMAASFFATPLPAALAQQTAAVDVLSAKKNDCVVVVRLQNLSASGWLQLMFGKDNDLWQRIEKSDEVAPVDLEMPLIGGTMFETTYFGDDG